MAVQHQQVASCRRVGQARRDLAVTPPQADDHRVELVRENQFADAAADEFRKPGATTRLHQLRPALAGHRVVETRDRVQVQAGIVVQRHQLVRRGLDQQHVVGQQRARRREVVAAAAVAQPAEQAEALALRLLQFRQRAVLQRPSFTTTSSVR